MNTRLEEAFANVLETILRSHLTQEQQLYMQRCGQWGWLWRRGACNSAYRDFMYERNPLL